MLWPLTRTECEEQLVITREKYLTAEQRREFFDAGRYYEQLVELGDLFQHLPLQRTSEEASCAVPSTVSAPTASR